MNKIRQQVQETASRISNKLSSKIVEPTSSEVRVRFDPGGLSHKFEPNRDGGRAGDLYGGDCNGGAGQDFRRCSSAGRAAKDMSGRTGTGAVQGGGKEDGIAGYRKGRYWTGRARAAGQSRVERADAGQSRQYRKMFRQKHIVQEIWVGFLLVSSVF